MHIANGTTQKPCVVAPSFQIAAAWMPPTDSWCTLRQDHAKHSLLYPHQQLVQAQWGRIKCICRPTHALFSKPSSNSFASILGRLGSQFRPFGAKRPASCSSASSEQMASVCRTSLALMRRHLSPWQSGRYPLPPPPPPYPSPPSSGVPHQASEGWK